MSIPIPLTLFDPERKLDRARIKYNKATSDVRDCEAKLAKLRDIESEAMNNFKNVGLRRKK